MTWEEFEQIKNTENLLDKDIIIKKAMDLQVLFLRMPRKYSACLRGNKLIRSMAHVH
jgi:hypothetical protein